MPLNLALKDIDATKCEEFNDAHTIVLHKGHSKDRNLATSYRTMSTCPFIAKATDSYLRELSLEDWYPLGRKLNFLAQV